MLPSIRKVYYYIYYKWTIAPITCKDIHRYFSADIKHSRMWTIFWEQSLRKTVSSKEQIMSKEKHMSIFWHQLKAILFFYPSNVLTKFGENVNIQRIVSWVGCLLFRVLWYHLMKKKFPFFCRHKVSRLGNITRGISWEIPLF